jgi:phosphoheptose isomerase
MSTVHDLHAGAPPADGALARFPALPYPSAGTYFDAYAAETARATSSIDPAALDQAAELLLAAYTRGARVFCCGNGGSAAIANHLQCDHVKGVATSTDLRPRVVSLSTSLELITAIANDISFDDVFAYQLHSQASAGDVLIAISSSGRSPNIVRALTWARDHDLGTIALTGFGGGEAREIADVSVHVDGSNYGVVEDLHQAVMHALAQYLRQSRMTPEAITASVF